MVAAKEDFLAHQQRSDHKNAEQKKIDELSKVRLTAVKTIWPAASVPTAETHGTGGAGLASNRARPNVAGDGAESVRPSDTDPAARPVPPYAMGNETHSKPAQAVKSPPNPFQPAAAAVPPNPFQRSVDGFGGPQPDANKYVVRVGKLPWVATKRQVIELFDGIRVCGVHFIVPNDRTVQNDAFVEVASVQDLQSIQQFRKTPSTNHIFRNVHVQGISQAQPALLIFEA